MKIYFPTIVFHNQPIVWEFNEETDEATCLFYCVNEDTTPKSRGLIMKILTAFANIEMEESSAVIKKVSTFKEKMVYVDEKAPKSSSLPMKLDLSRANSSFFTRIPTSPRTPVTPRPHAKSSSAIEPTLEESIKLKMLIPKSDPSLSSLWGDTVAYKKYFLRKNNDDKNIRAAHYVRSAFAFILNVQYEKNDHLYPLKSNIITAIEELLNLMNPVYVQWCKENTALEDKHLLVKYFRNAVLESMLNASINDKPTDFEELTQSHYSPRLREDFLKEAYTQRTNFMLMKFLALISDKFSPEHAVNVHETPKLLPVVASLRQFFLKQKPELLKAISLKLQEIAQYIVESGKIEILNNELSEKIKKELATLPVVRGFTSFRTILEPLVTSDKIKKTLLLSVLNQVTQETMQEINKHFPQTDFSKSIATLGTFDDKDFYVTQDWVHELTTKLQSIKFTKHPKDPKKIQEYAVAVAKQVVEFLSTLVKLNKAMEEAPSSSSSTIIQTEKNNKGKDEARAPESDSVIFTM